ncbi:hypothetical protein V6C06_24990, partial [Vreelandella titanicae]
MTVSPASAAPAATTPASAEPVSAAAFVDRHIGARRQSDVDTMLKAVGYDTVDALVDTAVPKDIRQDSPLKLAGA